MPVFLGTALQNLDEMPSSYDIHADGDIVGLRHQRLLLEVHDALVLVQLQDSETGEIVVFIRHFRVNYRNVRIFLDMSFQHLAVIQLIHTVAGGYDHVRLMALFQIIHVLVECVRRAEIPGIIVLRDCRCENVQPSLFSSEVPPFAGTQMLI